MPAPTIADCLAGWLEDGVLRKFGANVLALPVLALVYLALLGRAGLTRAAAGLGAALVVALVVTAGLPPAPGNALPASSIPAPVDARVVEALATGHGLKDPLRVRFDAPMDVSSVAAAMRLVPDAAIDFTWDDTGTLLTITPVTAWQPDTLYVLTVTSAARAADGGALAAPVRAAVLTATAGRGAIEATRAGGKRARIDTAFRIVLDRPLALATVTAALHTSPAVSGTVRAGATAGEYLFTPAAPLAVDATYRLTLDGLADSDGIPFAEVPSLVVRTAGAPEVVRFRPVAGETKVDRTAAISVRFTEAMNRTATAKAFRVTIDGKAIAGKTTWAEAGTVLVFVPDKSLPYQAKVTATVGATAVSKLGAPVAEAASGTFKVAAKPKQATPAKPSTKPIPRSGGGGAVSAGWYGVETYYLRLMNCTRTGGWVTSDGSCSSPGGRDVAALTLNSGISTRVARPYAKLLATRNLCDHFVGGNPGDRLRRAGYTSYRWGENLGCRSGNPYSAVLGSHRYFQSEKSYNGGHYVNLMDARFKQVGIGVWVSSGRVRLVVDFYTP